MTTSRDTYLPGGLFVNGSVTVDADPTQPLELATKQYVDAHAGSGGGGVVGEITTASNIGTLGVGTYRQKVGSDLQFRNLVGGTNIMLTVDNTTNNITISATGTAVGEANTASNQGTGAGVFKIKNGLDLQFRSIKAGNNITITQNTDEILIDGSALAATGANLGAGAAVFAGQSGNDLQFRRLQAGSGVTITENTNDITISTGTTFSNPTLNGNITLGSGSRLLGQHATLATAPIHQSTNGTVSRVRVIAPTGGTKAGFTAYGGSDPANSNLIGFESNSTTADPSIFFGKNVATTATAVPLGTKLYFSPADGSNHYANVVAAQNLSDFKLNATSRSLTTKEYVDDAIANTSISLTNPTLTGTVTLNGSSVIKGNFGYSNGAIFQSNDNTAGTYFRIRGPNTGSNGYRACALEFGANPDLVNSPGLRLQQDNNSCDVHMQAVRFINGAYTNPAVTEKFYFEGNNNVYFANVPFTTTLADYKANANTKSLTTKEYVDDSVRGTIEDVAAGSNTLMPSAKIVRITSGTGSVVMPNTTAVSGDVMYVKNSTTSSVTIYGCVAFVGGNSVSEATGWSLPAFATFHAVNIAGQWNSVTRF